MYLLGIDYEEGRPYFVLLFPNLRKLWDKFHPDAEGASSRAQAARPARP